MKRIPLRHVPLFWLGLLPVVMLLWAWADSTRYHSRVDYRVDRMREFRVTLFASSLRISGMKFQAATADAGEWPPYELAPTPAWGEWVSMRDKPDPADLFPRPRFTNERVQATSKWVYYLPSLVMPLWLILLAWLPLWLGAAWWQARRKARWQRAMENEVPG